jgi:asparagine synthetase B (glutamine-hydrolysing)
MTGALRTADLVAEMADYILSQHPSRFTAQTLPHDQSLLEPADAELRIADFQAETRATLDRAFDWLARQFEGCQFAVCLSGGLDSSVIASFAARHLPGVAAASFTYLDADDLNRHAFGAPAEQLASASDDFRAATEVAETLGLPLLPVVRPSGAVAGAIGPSVRLGQDWRDFNVHCAA